MKLKQAASAAMAAAMTASMLPPPIAFAADEPGATTVELVSDESEQKYNPPEASMDSADQQTTLVYAAVNGNYVLTVPESINLHKANKADFGSGTYVNDKQCKVNLRGDIGYDQVVSLDVTDSVMKSKGSPDQKANVDISSKSVWNRDDLFAGAVEEADGGYSEPTGSSTVYPVSAKLTPGDWVGTVTFNCTLSNVPTMASIVTGITPTVFDYDGREHSPGLIFANGVTLEEGVDYEISGDKAKSEEGKYSITITALGKKHVGSVTYDWEIKKYDISDAVSGLDKDRFENDGSTHTPNIQWNPGFEGLVKDKDYTITGTPSASDDGNYTITITGIGKYKGSVDLKWNIFTPIDISLAVKGIDPGSFDYDGQKHTPTILWKPGYENLIKDKDYQVTGTPSASAEGEYIITITGMGKYKGSVDLNWTVKALPEISTAIAGITPEHFDYDGQEHTPSIVWNMGYENLVEGVDYEISGDTTKSACGDYTLTVTGIGKYKGTATFNWNIRELIPVNAVYTIKKTGEKLVGDGKSVYFPLEANDQDTYVDEDYTYSFYWSPQYSAWTRVAVNDKTKTSYGPIRSYICDKNITDLYETFKGCANMIESPAIPDSVAQMESTFYGCKKLSIAPIIPANVHNISHTFDGCKSLKSYVGSTDPDGDFSKFKIPDGVTSMRYTFSGCEPIVNAPVIPNDVRNMSGTFSSCSSLIEAPVIPDRVMYASNTFSGCVSLKSYVGSTDPDGDFSKFKIPAGVTDMDGTFSSCGLLTVAPVIPAGVTNMEFTFSGCKSLKTYAGSADSDGDFSKFRIPAGVTNMEYTFSGCKSLVNAPVIPASVTNMGGTFWACTALVEAPVIPETVTDMFSTFMGCASLKSYAGSTDPDGDFSNYKVPDSVTNMAGTFEECVSLTKAPTIPASVTAMDNEIDRGSGTFKGCTNLTGTLICNANPKNYGTALQGTKITAIEGSCTKETKIKLLSTR